MVKHTPGPWNVGSTARTLIWSGADETQAISVGAARTKADALIFAASLELLASLRAILPYAESRAEDMEAEALLWPKSESVTEPYRKAVAAVDAAKALLASLDGDAPDAADASEGAALIVIWALPYSPDVAKDALGHFTPAEAAALLGMDQAEIVAKLDAAGSFQTEAHHVELDE